MKELEKGETRKKRTKRVAAKGEELAGKSKKSKTNTSSTKPAENKVGNAGKMQVKTSGVVYEPTKYLCTLSALKETLEKYGVAVIENVLNAEEVQKMNNGMWDALEEMTAEFSGHRETKTAEPIAPISRSDPSTWSNIRELMPMHRFLIQRWGIGHAKYAWDVRGNQKVCEVFAQLHGVKPTELISSFDGAAIYLPPGGREGAGGREENLWLHTDQRFSYAKNPRRYSVQAWVTGFDVPVGGATLAFLEGSHQHHAAFARQFSRVSNNTADWYKLEQQAEFDFLHSECHCRIKAIACSAGSMVLFDSRLFHSGMGPLKLSTPGPPVRNVVYVCMAPRSWSSRADLKKRQAIFEKRRLTSHCPYLPTMFPFMPRTYGKALQKIKPPTSYTIAEMTPIMRALVPLEANLCK